MSLEEKAKEYALKALGSEIEKVQKAYIDGYNAAKADEPFIDENGINLYSWLKFMKKEYRDKSKRLSDMQISLLNQIGMVW